MTRHDGSNAGLLAASSVASALFGIIVGYITGTEGSLGPSRRDQ